MFKIPPFVYFGTSEFAVIILEQLKQAGFLPSLIVTREDKPQGRHMTITPPPVKIWAQKNNIDILQSKKLDSDFYSQLKLKNYELFIIASYGKIIPQSILDLPKYKTLNVHPSILPKLRGPAPIQGTILEENEAGVTIMRIDAEMDHGPILAQAKVKIFGDWPPYEDLLEKILAEAGGKLLAETIPGWISGEIKEIEQNHDESSYTSIVKKEDAKIDLSDDAEINLRKVRAYSIWPKAYTVIKRNDKDVRVIITKANIVDGVFAPESVIPEGKKEMSWEDFQRGSQNK